MAEAVAIPGRTDGEATDGEATDGEATDGEPAATANDGAITAASASRVPVASALPARRVREATGSLTGPLGKA
ncbi:hypothetical protein [Frankia sp. Cj3]|uniref:hypothetical protein n=1 Tax=Frankia sp. Cj3 TaxID=2880976 RepID=UPI001EF62FBF|nr:hypothetical protein [Frankia sp. Cj3]